MMIEEWLSRWIYVVMAVCLCIHCLNKCMDDSSDDENNATGDIEAGTRSNAASEPKENRIDVIRSRLLFQQLLALPTSEDSKKVEISERISHGTTTTSKDDEEDGVVSNDTSLRTSANASSVRSLLFSSLVFFNDSGVKDGPDEDQVREAAKSVRNRDCCSICLEEYVVGDVVAQLKPKATACERTSDVDAKNTPKECRHCFHEDCILEWLQNHDECPLCRIDMMNGGDDDEKQENS